MSRHQKKKIFSTELGIDVQSGREEDLFKWFLACLFFGKPIQQEVAKKVYQELIKAGLITPEKILEAGWDELVRVLDEGHYVRYDFSTATKLLDVCRTLKEKYGTITTLINQSGSRKELEKRLLEFKGVGDKTAEIFMRDLNKV
jgi:endonuclease III